MTLLQSRPGQLSGSDTKLLSYCFYYVFKNIKLTKLLQTQSLCHKFYSTFFLLQQTFLQTNATIALRRLNCVLLLELMKSSGRVLSREQLLDNVWGISANVDSRTVDVHIGRLRKSIKKVTDDKVIKTVRSFGYSLIDKS